MDKGAALDSRKILNYVYFKATIALALLFHPTLSAKAHLPMTPRWKATLKKKLSELEASNPEQFGLYVKNLSTGEELSYRGEETWYLASGVKVPIAIETFHQIEESKISLDTPVSIELSDYIDGAGQTNSLPPGSRVSVRYLLEQMLIYSDNTASDLLIKLVGLREVNARTNSIVPGGFSPITTLSDVRRLAYGSFHPKAAALKNAELVMLRQVKGEKARIKKLAHLLNVQSSELAFQRIDDAFRSYYSQKFNSASLVAYGKLLEQIVRRQALSAKSTDALLDIMSRVKTGEARIKAGLPRSTTFAHKTGTQHARVCDFGLAWNKNEANGARIVISACTRGFMSEKTAETMLRELGKAVTDSGVLELTAQSTEG